MHPQLLPSQRLAAILTLSALLLGGLLVVPPPARAAEVGLWTPVPPMARARTSHTATPLANGQVLVAGVSGGESDTAEVYDPATSTWRQTGS
ncbi:MAG: kelch repeat-containing protein [Chloroflexia bacterium]